MIGWYAYFSAILKDASGSLSGNVQHCFVLANSFVSILCEHIDTIAESAKKLVLSFEIPHLSQSALMVYEYISGAIRDGTKFLGLNEWCGIDHYILLA